MSVHRKSDHYKRLSIFQRFVCFLTNTRNDDTLRAMKTVFGVEHTEKNVASFSNHFFQKFLKNPTSMKNETHRQRFGAGFDVWSCGLFP